MFVHVCNCCRYYCKYALAAVLLVFVNGMVMSYAWVVVVPVVVACLMCIC